MRKVVRTIAKSSKHCAHCPAIWKVGDPFDFANNPPLMLCTDCGDKFVGAGRGFRENGEKNASARNASETFDDANTPVSHRADDSLPHLRALIAKALAEHDARICDLEKELAALRSQLAGNVTPIKPRQER